MADPAALAAAAAATRRAGGEHNGPIAADSPPAPVPRVEVAPSSSSDSAAAAADADVATTTTTAGTKHHHRSAARSLLSAAKKKAAGAVGRPRSRSQEDAESSNPLLRHADLEHGGGSSGGETVEVMFGGKKLFSLVGGLSVRAQLRDKAKAKFSRGRHGGGDSSSSSSLAPGDAGAAGGGGGGRDRRRGRSAGAAKYFSTNNPPPREALPRATPEALAALEARARATRRTATPSASAAAAAAGGGAADDGGDATWAAVDAHALSESVAAAAAGGIRSLAAALTKDLPRVQPVSEALAWRKAAATASADAAAAAAAAGHHGAVEGEKWSTDSPPPPELEIARAVYVWVTHNVSYDAAALFAGREPAAITASETLASRVTVCEGYANLVYALCRLAGVNCFKIGGRASATRFELDTGRADLGHAWNAVCVHGLWFLLDSTWGAGYVGESHTFTRAPDDFFFLTPPARLVRSHLPDWPQWQLSEGEPMTSAEFDQLVGVKAHFFERGLKLVSHLYGTINVTSAAMPVVLLAAPQGEVGWLADVKLVDDEHHDTRKLDRNVVLIQPASAAELAAVGDDALTTAGVDTAEDAVVAFHLRLPGPGTYHLEIYTKEKGGAKPPTDKDTYQKTLEYAIEVAEGVPACASAFPATMSVFTSKSHVLYEPLDANVALGPVTVRIGAGAATEMQLLVEPAAPGASSAPKKQWTPMKRGDDDDDGIYTATLALDDPAMIGGRIRVMAKYDSGAAASSRYSEVLSYNLVSHVASVGANARLVGSECGR